jgi:hypothetical protein
LALGLPIHLPRLERSLIEKNLLTKVEGQGSVFGKKTGIRPTKKRHFIDPPNSVIYNRACPSPIRTSLGLSQIWSLSADRGLAIGLV